MSRMSDTVTTLWLVCDLLSSDNTRPKLDKSISQLYTLPNPQRHVCPAWRRWHCCRVIIFFILSFSYHMKMTKRAFTLVEMLIVIVIIGILAAALIPRLTGIQGRARDTSRQGHLNQINSALQLYAVDHNGWYPVGTGQVNTIFTGSDTYINELPIDPNGAWSITATDCSAATNKEYAYSSNGISAVVSAKMENAGQANSSSCSVLNKTGDSVYYVIESK